ncbi:hypothetical protein M427DRAFT_27232 [Gonapodya prolifera JEL478]|uniref:Uncharacterized protein n=1 Tax=Gonapodya prolifera (strain JEL478) TaxID=1344416 RepID=A0A139AYR6_GONPJ|nr:hypothetical protein M427DRAFT_27232 [Gonapodya prolifera JEL478]|eukprot:KXS21605.1 hypothetical protein M427DRAFT_27232 [Gonapodya prolifera JEL478]
MTLTTHTHAHGQHRHTAPSDSPAGVSHAHSESARDVLNSLAHPLLQERLDAVQLRLYRKTEHKPLGKSSSNTEGLPDKDYTYGLETAKNDAPVRSLFNYCTPDPPHLRRLYVVSHHAYEPGEHQHYPYDVPPSSQPSGGRVIHQENGKGVKDAMHWPLESRIVDLRYQTYQEKHSKVVGTANASHKVVEKLGPEHAFGIRHPKEPPFSLAHPSPEPAPAPPTSPRPSAHAKCLATPDDLPAGRPSHQREGAMGSGRMRKKFL